MTELPSLVAAYAAQKDAQLYADISKAMAEMACGQGALDDSSRQQLEALMLQCGKVEPIWGLMAALRLWAAGVQTAGQFNNVWNLARYAGIQSRFSHWGAQDHLNHVATLHQARGNAASWLIAGNALRQLHRYADAESVYLQGLDHCVDDPFLKFRLVDLWLMTYQHDRAAHMLASLRARFPFALEMMFAQPVPVDEAAPTAANLQLSPATGEVVWLVSADPVYVERYGPRWAQSVAARVQHHKDKVNLHLHVVRDAAQAVPEATLAQVAALLPAQLTQRTMNLTSASANQRSAVFASERFLLIADLLQHYGKPMLVTDIDVECLQDPRPLFARMQDADIGYTRFHTVRDAWDRYPATALLVQPTAASIAFFRRVAQIITALLQTHPQPWFVDQIALFRVIENGESPAKLMYLEHILSDLDVPGSGAYFKILHASWEQ